MTEAATMTIKVDASDLLDELEKLKTPPLQVKRLSPHAKLPTRGSPGAVGYDLYYAGTTPMGVGVESQNTVPTGIAVRIPEGYYGRVAPRSGLGSKGIDVHGGVIDPDYRGEIKVMLFNHGSAPLWIEPGDRVAQLVLEAVATPEVEEVDELSDTERGDKGFGSTGMQ